MERDEKSPYRGFVLVCAIRGRCFNLDRIDLGCAAADQLEAGPAVPAEIARGACTDLLRPVARRSSAACSHSPNVLQVTLRAASRAFYSAYQHFR